MKKALAILLLLVLGVVGCGENNQIQDAGPSQDPEPGEKKQQDEFEAIEVLKKLGASVKNQDSYRRRRGGGGYSVACGAPVTDADLVHLKRIRNLRYLKFIKGSQVTDAGLLHLVELTELYYLDLFDTQVTDDGLRHLKRLTKLQTLHLKNTAISDAGLLHLKGMSSLERLDLSAQTIDTVLEHLFVKSNASPDPPNPEIADTVFEHLADLKSLGSGEVSNPTPTEALLERLKSLASLASLDGSNPEVTDDLLEYLTSLTGLKELSLPDQVTDAGLLHLAGMRSLEALYLNNTQVTDAGVAELQKALPNCKIIH